MLINTPQFHCLVFTHLDVHSPMLIFKRKRNHITTYQKETGYFFLIHKLPPLIFKSSKFSELSSDYLYHGASYKWSF